VEPEEVEKNDDFEREMSRNLHMEGARKIKMEDISFESETYNIYEPFFSSESDEGYSDSSDDQSCYDSESAKSSPEDDSNFTSQGEPSMLED